MGTAEPLPPRALRLWVLGAGALAVLPQLARLPPALGLACAAALLWRLGADLGRWPLPGRVLRLLTTLGAVGGVLGTYHTVVGRDAGAALLVALLCLKALEVRQRRDLVLVVALSYFLVAIGFLFDQSPLAGAHGLLATLVLTAALVALTRPRRPRAGDARDALRLAGGLLLQAAPLAVVLFLAFPRLQAPLWGMPEAGFARTGLSEHMAPGDIGRLAESEAVAFRVEFAAPAPAADRLYWRGPVLSEFDGRVWRRGVQAAAGELHYVAQDAGVHYTVTLEPHGRRWAFALDLPAAPPPGMQVGPQFALRTAEPVREPLRYRLVSHLRYRAAGSEETGLTRYLRLPREAAPRARALARRWRAAQGSGAAVVQTALHWFAAEPFRYTLHPPPLDKDPVDGFLFGTRQGFCEHFASAFTVLMRAAGVPARVVTGYLGAERNPLGGHYIVRQSNAHAWSEVWLPQRGWMRVDPTALVPPERVDRSARRLGETAGAGATGGGPQWVRRLGAGLGYGWDRLDFLWHRWVAGYDTRRQAELFRALRHRSAWMPLLAALGLAAGALLLGRALARRRAGAPPDPAAAQYARLCRKLARTGLRRGAAEAPRAFAARVAAARPDLAAEVQRLTERYLGLRYGRCADAAPALADLRKSVRRLRTKSALTSRCRNWRRSAPADPRN